MTRKRNHDLLANLRLIDVELDLICSMDAMGFSSEMIMPWGHQAGSSSIVVSDLGCAV